MEQFETVVRFVVATLIDGLWQAPLFAFAAWLVLRLQPGANATTRHSVLATALFASLLLPVVTASFALRHVPDAAATANDVTLPKGAVSSLPQRTTGRTAPERVPDAAAASAPSAAASAPAFSVPTFSRFNLSIPRALAFVLAGLWFAGAAFVVIRLAISLLHLERLKRDALPLSVEYRAQLGRWATASSGSHSVRLCTSPEIDIPIAVGLFDAMILVPERFLQELDPHDIDSIVLHELAHLRRADDWFNAIERFAQALLFFNPGIIWLVGQLDLEREVACDDWVLQQNDALPYATCLARVAETTAWPHRAMTAPGAFVTRRGMSIRIERLLSKQRDVRVRTSFGPAGAAVAVVAVLGAVAALVSPSIAYDVTVQPPQPPAAPGVAAHASPAAPKAQSVSAAAKQKAAVVALATATAELATAPAAPVPAPAPSAAASPEVTLHAVNPLVSPPHPPVAPHPNLRLIIVPSAPVIVNEAQVQRAAAELERKALAAENAANVQENLADQLHDAASNKAEVIADAKDPDYIDELARAGYSHLSVDDLVALKSVGVSGDFIAGLRREGLTHPTVHDLIKLRALGIEPEYIGAMRRRFGTSLDSDELAGLRALHVTPDYVDGLTSAGLKNLRPTDVQGLRAVGVSPDYVRGLVRAGYPNLTIEQVQQLRAIGIDGEFIDRAAAHGMHHLSVDELTRLKVTGIL